MNISTLQRLKKIEDFLRFHREIEMAHNFAELLQYASDMRTALGRIAEKECKHVYPSGQMIDVCEACLAQEVLDKYPLES